jgi:peptidoglycan-N-acetylglucosamine deacetylase
MGAIGSMKTAIYNRLTPFHLTGISAVLLSVILFSIKAILAPVPLLLFAFICIVAPFITGKGFFLKVISKGRTDTKAIAVTFDDGPDPDVTPAVLDLLQKYSVKATFFVTGKNAEKYPDIIGKILEQGHSIGNHSYNHDPLLMLRTKKTLLKEISLCQKILQKHGISPFAFRPPAGITNPRLNIILRDLDMFCINWSLRALDAGNRRIKGLSEKILGKAESGDIILLHDIKPDNNNINILLSEFEFLFSGLKNSDLKIEELSVIINKKIMSGHER